MFGGQHNQTKMPHVDENKFYTKCYKNNILIKSLKNFGFHWKLSKINLLFRIL